MKILERVKYMRDRGNGAFDETKSATYTEIADHIKELHDILHILTADPKTQPYSAKKEWRDMVCNVRLRIAAVLEA